MVGTINATGAITSDTGSGCCGADYVFDLYYDGRVNWSKYGLENSSTSAEYNMVELAELGQFLQSNKHLPGIPPSSEPQEVDLIKRDAKLLEKIEEQALYIIQLNEQNQALTRQNQKFEKRLQKLEHNPPHPQNPPSQPS